MKYKPNYCGVYGGVWVKFSFRANTLMMKVVSTSETSVNFYKTTRRKILEDNYLHTRCCEDFKSQILDINRRTSWFIQITQFYYESEINDYKCKKQSTWHKIQLNSISIDIYRSGIRFLWGKKLIRNPEGIFFGNLKKKTGKKVGG